MNAGQVTHEEAQSRVWLPNTQRCADLPHRSACDKQFPCSLCQPQQLSRPLVIAVALQRVLRGGQLSACIFDSRGGKLSFTPGGIELCLCCGHAQ
jgi:hypothetical protein